MVKGMCSTVRVRVRVRVRVGVRIISPALLGFGFGLLVQYGDQTLISYKAIVFAT